MKNNPAELYTITREILDPEKSLADLIPQALALRDLFEKLTHFSIDHERDIGAGETRLEHGLAISPTLAAMCIRELFRTLAFIRGLNQAIHEAGYSGFPVRVLYAGCGPYALLALPLMTMFARDQLVFTLLDIHQESLDRALALIDSFGFAHYVADALCVDATRYQIPADSHPDIIVSETMAVCLHNEPQVTIARRLLAQAPDARLVPQSVSVEVCMLDASREHVLLPSDYVGDILLPERDRVYLGKIFELDAVNIQSWEKLDGERLPAASVKIPLELESRYHPCLLTRIAVYGEHRLQDYDSSLTMPQRLSGKDLLSGGETLNFHYKLGSYPELVYEVVA